MASTNENLNTFKENDLIIVNETGYFLHNQKGYVKNIMGGSCDCLMDNGLSIIIYFTKLKKQTKSKKKKKTK